MNEGFQFIDVILFAIVAGFLILRLRSVLGRRDGHQGRGQDPFAPRPQPEPQQKPQPSEDNVVNLPDRNGRPADAGSPPPVEALAPQDRLSSGLTQIGIADARFEPAEFESGARIAFEMILNAFASGDADSLKPLLSSEVLSNFNQSIRDRATRSERLDTKLVALRSAEIVEAYMAGRTAHVTVKFVSEQISALYDADETVIDGHPSAIIEVTDFWTFARDTRSSDPNWALVATGTLD